MLKKITDIGSRAAKTFFQAFASFLLVEIIKILLQINQGAFDFGDIKSWLMTVGVPVLAGALAAGFSAIQNTIINAKDSKGSK